MGGEDPLPDGVAELHRELDAVRIEERASFGPELRAELEAAWEEMERGGDVPRRSRSSALLAASVAGLLFLGLSAPQARAALAGIVGTVRESLFELVQPAAELEALPEPRMIGTVDVRPPEAAAEVARDEAPVEGNPPDDAVETGGPPDVAVVFPDLLDRAQASRLVKRYYPGELAGTALGGTVRLRMYVDSAGDVVEVRLIGSSGVELLDEAAVRAAPSLQFRPARKGDTAVGTWVELGIDFAPGPGSERGDGGDSAPY